MQSKISTKAIAALFFVGLGYAVMMGFTYLQYVYYDGMREALKATNAQLGFLITIQAIGGVLTLWLGGIIVDRFDYRKVLTLSLLGTIPLFIWFAVAPAYTNAILIWIALVITLGGYYPAVIKTARIIAPEKSQGLSYGLFACAQAIGFIIVNFIGLGLYNKYSVAGAAAGISAVMWVYASIGVISVIFGYILLMSVKDPELQGSDENAPSTKITKRDFINVLKNPGTWLFTITVFCVYTVHTTMGFFTPYFTRVIGITIVFSGILTVINRYGIRLLIGPIGGWYGDKIGSTAQVIRFCFACFGVLILSIMALPKGTSFIVIIIATLLLAILDNLSLGLVFSTAPETMIPRKYMGILIGIACTFSPDLYQQALFGYLLDVFGNRGFTYMFSYTALFCLIGVVSTSVIIIRERKNQIS